MATANPEAGLSNFPPRIRLVPQGRVRTFGPQAVKLAEYAGTLLFPWQCDELDYILAQDVNDQWTAQTVAIVLARQNGKGEVLAARELFGAMLLGEIIIHTAHLVPTAIEAFKRLEKWVNHHPDLKAKVKNINRTNGRHAIEFESGGGVYFMARNDASGRGFTADVVVFDEAMMMSSQAAAALDSTISAVDNPQLIYTGSAATNPAKAEVFGGIRADALECLENPDPENSVYYAEWSAEVCDEFCPKDLDCTVHDPIDDPRTWAKANPSLGLLQTVRKIKAEYARKRKTGLKEFLCERLSVGDWPVAGGGWRVIREPNWTNQHDPDSEISGVLALGLDVSPDRSSACISAAGYNDYGMYHVEVTGNPDAELHPVDHREGFEWLVPRLVELKAHKPCVVVIDDTTEARYIVDDLTNAGIEVVHPTAKDYAEACSTFRSKVVPPDRDVEPTLVHLDQAPLNLAIAGAEKRELKDLWAWSRKDSATDITPVVSATLALWGLMKFGHKKKLTPWIRRGRGGN